MNKLYFYIIVSFALIVSSSDICTVPSVRDRVLYMHCMIIVEYALYRGFLSPLYKNLIRSLDYKNCLAKIRNALI